MDCERFDRDCLELLYEELDDVTASALRRHVAQCPRCQPTWQRLNAVRKAAAIPLESPEPSVLEDVLARQEAARKSTPLGERLGTWVSVMAEYAMRPQLAMAALLVLMVGSSLVLVRTGPGRGDQVAVREVGSPELETPSPRAAVDAAAIPSDSSPQVAVSPEPVAPPSAASSVPGESSFSAKGKALDPVLAPTYEEAMAAYQDGRYAEAERLFGEVSKAGGEKAGAAALHEAHAARNGSGCQRAASYYDEVALQFEGTSVANEAAWHAALCYRALGQVNRARAHLERLRSQPAYVARVEKLLNQAEGEAVATRAALPAAAPPEAKAEAATPPTKPARAPASAKATAADAASSGSAAAKPAPTGSDANSNAGF